MHIRPRIRRSSARARPIDCAERISKQEADGYNGSPSSAVWTKVAMTQSSSPLRRPGDKEKTRWPERSTAFARNRNVVGDPGLTRHYVRKDEGTAAAESWAQRFGLPATRTAP